MTIHVNIGAAKTRLSELVAAALNGEDVILAKAGAPQVRLVPVNSVSEDTLEVRAARRLAAFGMWRGLLTHEQATVPASMTDDELQERWDRKFGSAA